MANAPARARNPGKIVSTLGGATLAVGSSGRNFFGSSGGLISNSGMGSVLVSGE